MTTTARELADHKHTHSLYVHCLSCQMFGTPTPTRFIDAVECGNCGSMETVKYYPSCCILAERNVFPNDEETEKYINKRVNGYGYLSAHAIAAEILAIKKWIAKLKEPT